MAKGKKIRVLIGDSRPIFRIGLKQLLSQEPDISLVGEAGTSQQVLKMVGDLKPEVLILDALLTGGNDPDVLAALQQKQKNTRVIFVESSGNEEDSLRAVRLGTTGLVPKQAPYRQVVECIRKVSAGERCVDTHLAAAVRKQTSGLSLPSPKEKDSSPLSPREIQVVTLVSQGFRNKEIAQRMFISEQTVKNHLHNIFDKLGVSDRLELALYAIHKHLSALL